MTAGDSGLCCCVCVTYVRLSSVIKSPCLSNGTISSFSFFVLFRGPVPAVRTRDRLQGSSEPTNRSYSSSL